MSVLDAWHRWLNTPQHMTVAQYRELTTATAHVALEFVAPHDSAHDLAARLESMQAATFGGRPCPEQMPHGHGRSINGCARCHGDGHEDLWWEPLTHPFEAGELRFTHWAPCPTNGQPILMGVHE